MTRETAETISAYLREKLPDGAGFALFFGVPPDDPNKGSSMSVISNMQRPQIRATMQTFINGKTIHDDDAN